MKYITLLLFSFIISTSCNSDLYIDIELKGQWNVDDLHVVADFSGKKSEYSLKNAGAYTFSSKGEGKYISTADTSYDTQDIHWETVKKKHIKITYLKDNSEETWLITSDVKSTQTWECTKTVIYSSGGVSSTANINKRMTLRRL